MSVEPGAPARGRLSALLHRRGKLLVDLALTMGLVAIVGAVVLRYFPLYGKSLIWQFDGLAQHYPALYFFNTWIRGIIRHPELGIPLWSWNMGLGADIIGTLEWPVLGDPFALVSLAFPMRLMESAFATMFVLRLLASGVTSALYLRVMRAKPLPAAMGAIAYVFCTYLFYQGRHPYFINAMVFLPLILTGIEWALADKRRWPLTAIAFFAAAANFYFFYMLTIVAIIYAIARYFDLAEKPERWRKLLPAAARVGGHYALGAILAAPLLLTAAAAVAGTARSQSGVLPGAFYKAYEYGSLLASLSSSTPGAKSTFLGFAFLGLVLAPVVYFARKRYGALKFLLLAYVALVGLPVFGWVLNGMSFPSNRFSFSWGIFFALAAALLLSEDRAFEWREIGAMCGFLVVYVAAVFVIDGPLRVDSWLPMALGAVTIAIFAFERARSGARPWEARARMPRMLPARWRSPWTRWLVLAVLIGNVVANGAFTYDAAYMNRLAENIPAGEVQRQYTSNTGRIAAKLPKDHFYRIDNADTLVYNSSMVQGFPSTSFYFSTMSGSISQFKADIVSRTGPFTFAYDGFDDRVEPTTLVGVEYYLAKPGETSQVPFGFTKVLKSGKAIAFKNQYALPLGFVYHDTIARSDFERLDPVNRSGAMLQGAVVDDAETGLATRVKPVPEAVEIPYSVIATDGAVFDAAAGTLVRTTRRSSIILSAPPVPDAELYVELSDFDNRVATPTVSAAKPSVLDGIRSVAGANVFLQPTILPTAYSTKGVRKTVQWRTPESPYYWGNRTQLVNMGYQPNGISRVRVRPWAVGTLTFKSLKMYALPMAEYPARIAKLKAGAMRDIVVSTNKVSGTVSTDRNGILFLSIPFSTGWTAEVDGKPATVLRVNSGFSGVAVTPGEHTVVLHYFTPGLRAGLLVGGAGLLVVIAMLAWGARRRRKPAPAAEPDAAEQA